MAEKRMFAKTIIDSDAFLDMPLSAQALYFHLSMRADDEGFINNPKKIMRIIRAQDDDLKLLIAKRFIIPFESGIVVIKHWKIHNYIRQDRLKETVYQEEKRQLDTKGNKSYTLISETCQALDGHLTNTLRTHVSQLTGSCPHRLDKTRLDKNSIYIVGQNEEEPDSTTMVKQEKYPYKEIVDHLNQVCDRKFSHISSKTQRLIKARVNEGFTVNDFKKVINNMYRAWGDDGDMLNFLRPDTLFSGKFDSYLNWRLPANTPSETNIKYPGED